MRDQWKVQARAMRKEAARERKQRAKIERAVQRELNRAYRRCFWTPPFGHEYVDRGEDGKRSAHCISCNKPDSYANSPTPSTVRR